MTVWSVVAGWYRAHGRDLPWRRRTDGYAVVVSEFMLQQTQVDRVVPLFLRFLETFPDWRALAEAPQADVVRAWKGLGYNLRAVRLKRLAEEVVARHAGGLPRDRETLLSLKGVGPYTARALSVFAHRERALAPDTNVRRVLTRVFKGAKADPKAFDERTWSRWEASLPPDLAYDVNQGLMDLGALVCKAGKPACEGCPLKTLCRSYPGILRMTNLPRQKAPARERVDAAGVPNRIYRGRVIEFLRSKAVAARRLGTLGRFVRPGFTPRDASWLRGVLAGLEKDGLVASEAGEWRLA